MHLASVNSQEEHDILNRMTNGVEAWLGGCRKSTSRQPSNSFDGIYEGAEDWEGVGVVAVERAQGSRGDPAPKGVGGSGDFFWSPDAKNT